MTPHTLTSDIGVQTLCLDRARLAKTFSYGLR